MSAEHTLPFQGALSPHWGQRGCAALLPHCLQPTSSSAGHSGEVRLDLLSVVYMMRGRYLNVPVVVVSALWLPVCCCCPEKVCDAGRLKPARLPPPLISRHQQHNQERRDSVQLVVQTCRHQTQSKQQTHSNIILVVTTVKQILSQKCSPTFEPQSEVNLSSDSGWFSKVIFKNFPCDQRRQENLKVCKAGPKICLGLTLVPLVLLGHDTIWGPGRPALAAVWWCAGHRDVLCQRGSQINGDLMSHRRENITEGGWWWPVLLPPLHLTCIIGKLFQATCWDDFRSSLRSCFVTPYLDKWWTQ